MIAMNARAELDGASFAAIAMDFADLPQSTQRGRDGFLGKLGGPDFWRLTGQHLLLVFVSLAAAIVVGIPLGVWAARSDTFAQPILSTVGVIQTIPALALLVFLIPLLGQIGTVPALVALFLYSLLPIVRNTYAGLSDIAISLRESAQALGLPATARLRLIELPLAARSILAGIKTSAVINVGTATIAAFIGAGGYGERIVTGLALNDHALLLAGAIPSAALALLVQWTFDFADRWVVAEGLR
jgi:osmoprotectant transport system permease protein